MRAWYEPKGSTGLRMTGSTERPTALTQWSDSSRGPQPNPENVWAASRRRKARKRGAEGTHTAKDV